MKTKFNHEHRITEKEIVEMDVHLLNSFENECAYISGQGQWMHDFLNAPLSSRHYDFETGDMVFRWMDKEYFDEYFSTPSEKLEKAIDALVMEFAKTIGVVWFSNWIIKLFKGSPKK